MGIVFDVVVWTRNSNCRRRRLVCSAWFFSSHFIQGPRPVLDRALNIPVDDQSCEGANFCFPSPV